MANPEHIKWLRAGVNYWNEVRRQRYFSPDFSGADIRAELALSFSGLSLEGINLENANFEEANLRGISLKKSRLQNAQFRKASLQFVDFTEADLSRTDFRNANLVNATFAQAYLSHTNLSYANLERADLRFAILIDTNITGAQPWKSHLYTGRSRQQPHFGFSKKIESIGNLVEKCQILQDHYTNHPVNYFLDDPCLFYFRGESDSSWELRPSLMRLSGSSQAGGFPDKEGEMLLDLMSQRPGDFVGVKSALSQWVLAQHHGLKTRFLDITRNPLVALFHACESSSHQDNSDHNNGVLHVFVAPKSLVKTFDSDSISIVANLAKLPRREQKTLMGKESIEFFSLLMTPHYTSAARRFYQFIMQEKPYFEKRIDIKDLFRVFVVEPERSFERIRVQSGAFLVSAFHERFERDEILKRNKDIPVYDYYRLYIPYESKEKILRELRLLNIKHEVLFPSLDEVAKAIVRRNS